jgi:hypothetical protein
MADLAIAEIAEYHADVLSALNLYFNQMLTAGDLGDRTEITSTRMARLEETDQRSAFFILARLEAAFRIDYEARCQKKMKDDLSRLSD